LWSVVKIVLLLSRGQATVETGFSVNRQVDDDNLHADTFCCRRLICDAVAYYGGIYAIDTSSSAWHKYQLDVEQKKTDAMKDTVTRKRKAVDDEIQSLKRRKLELSTDVDSLTASADQLAEKAESSRDMSILMKSNAMYKVCKEKTAEMTELDKQLAEKLLQQKNCE